MTRIPLALGKYANFIIQSEKQTISLEITPINEIDNTENSIICLPKENLNYQNNLNYFLMAQINLTQIINKHINNEKYFLPKNGYLSFNISTNNIDDICIDNLNLIYSSNSNLKINKDTSLYNHNHLFGLSFIEKTELCPLENTQNSLFYYGHFIDKISENEKKIFTSSDEFNINGNKIGGYHNFNPQHLELDNPHILLLQIDLSNFPQNYISHKLINKKIMWLIKQNDLLNLKFENTLVILN